MVASSIKERIALNSPHAIQGTLYGYTPLAHVDYGGRRGYSAWKKSSYFQGYRLFLEAPNTRFWKLSSLPDLDDMAPGPLLKRPPMPPPPDLLAGAAFFATGAARLGATFLTTF